MAATPISVDYSRPPTLKEQGLLSTRVARLEHPDHRWRIEKARASFGQGVRTNDLEIRHGFSYLAVPPNHEASDRKAPPREDRPSATRIATSRGGTLRFMLTLLALTQSNRKPGELANLNKLELPISGNSRETGWADFLVTDASDSLTQSTYLTARDKRARSVRSALRSLQNAGLVDIPLGVRGSLQYESFVLLNECGIETIGESEHYKRPQPGKDVFKLPAGFIDNGWLHVLSDMEIAVLMMIRCKEGAFSSNGWAFPAEIRLRNYGIHRDAFSSARKTLEWFGLINVSEVDRHDDGRAIEKALSVHRLEFVESGFENPAVQTALETLKTQISRA